MKILLIFLLLFVLLLCILFLVRVRLLLYFSVGKVSVSIQTCGTLIRLYPARKKDEPKQQPSDEKTVSGIGSLKKLWDDDSASFRKALLRLKKRVLIEKVDFQYICGFSDAAVTALMYGTVNGVYYNVFAFLDRNFRIKDMSGDIRPDFNSNNKKVVLDTVLRLTLADIIYIAVALLPLVKRIKNNF